MSVMRQKYFDELLKDCREVCKQNGISPDDEAIIVAAFVLSDSLNGIRKAMLTPSWLTAPKTPPQF